MMMVAAAEDIVAMTCVTPHLSSVRQSELCIVLCCVCAFAHFPLYSQFHETTQLFTIDSIVHENVLFTSCSVSKFPFYT